jgi:hypothetical protein
MTWRAMTVCIAIKNAFYAGGYSCLLTAELNIAALSAGANRMGSREKRGGFNRTEETMSNVGMSNQTRRMKMFTEKASVQQFFGYAMLILSCIFVGFAAGFLWTADDAYNLGWQRCTARIAYEVQEAMTTANNPDIWIGSLRIQLVNRDKHYYKVTYNGAGGGE